MSASALHTIIVLLLAYLAVFLAAADQPISRLLGVQINLVPALIVYLGLNGSWPALALVAVLCGLWFDALSSNPLGISVLPLFLVGFALKWHRDLILREAPYAQFVLGGLATASMLIISLLMLLAVGYKPILGWSIFPQWMLKAIIAAGATPLLFWLMARLQRALSHPQMTETSFRADREIKRGRV